MSDTFTDPRNLAALKKHYSIQGDALRDIVELIDLRDCYGPADPDDALQKVHDIAHAAVQLTLLNPHGFERAVAEVEAMPHQFAIYSL